MADDPRPFVPPEPQPASQAAPQYPPPTTPVASLYAPPPPAPTPPRPPRPGRTALIVSAIVVGVAVILTGVVLLALALANVVKETLEATGPISLREEAPPLTGEPGPTTPAQAEDCPEVCFTVDDVRATIPAAATLAALGATDQIASWSASQRGSVRDEYAFTARTWKDLSGEPDECFPAYFAAPLAVPFEERPEDAAGPIRFTGTWQDADGYTSVSTSVRIFPDAASASAHLSDVNRLVGGCTSYSSGSGVDYWSADVSLEPALDLPPTTAAAGWLEVGSGARYYTFDVQRSNLVVRSTLWASSTATEQQFRDFVQQLARQLAALEPGAQG